jgi:hypothetical protein
MLLSNTRQSISNKVFSSDFHSAFQGFTPFQETKTVFFLQSK